MSKNPDKSVTADYSYTQNRELSWLQFNRRVLEEAADESVPLLERLKFITIFSSNLDEFFMVRVGSLFDISLVSPQEQDNKTGQTAQEQLDDIYAAIPGLVEMKGRVYAQVSRLLAQSGVEDVSPAGLSGEERQFVNQYYQSRVLPILSPQIVDSHHPFPYLANKALYIAACLRDKKGDASLGFIPVPEALPRLLYMPGQPGRFLRMENLILHKASSLFGSFKAESVCLLSVTRNADLSFDMDKFEDSEVEDFRGRMSKLLKKRRNLSIIRLELCGDAGEELVKMLRNRTNVDSRQIFFDPTPLNMRYVYELESGLPAELTQGLLNTPYHPRWPADLTPKMSMIQQIQHHDRLLFFPYDQIDPFLRLLEEAAQRPDVLSIKITIYRLASSSKIAHILCKAAENGKDVTVLMELRARFDEAHNISWSKLMEEAGCHVIYGVENFKCHSKLCLITLQKKDGLQYITQIGTGNYNEKTSTMYTDLSLLTASLAVGLDATAFFQNMLVSNLEGNYQTLWVAPVGIKANLIRLIEEETAKGSEGFICIKANALTERQVIDKLMAASCAGVQIQLILRGICCLRPGIPGKTENIHVTSIVGRYLEHARIYCFGKGDDAQYFISSADLMTRNLNRRVEIACPIRNPMLREALQWILTTQLEDNVKASFLLSDGTYRRKVNNLVAVNSQEVFMAQSFHREEAPPQTPPPSHFHGFFSRLRKKKN